MPGTVRNTRDTNMTLMWLFLYGTYSNNGEIIKTQLRNFLVKAGDKI